MLNEVLNKIGSLDIDSMKAAQTRLDSLTKPLGSLGKLEDIIVKLSGINSSINPKVDNKAIVVMCADNGVVEEGVSSCPKSVTASVTCNFTRGITAVNVFSRLTQSKVVVVDVGVDADISNVAILNRKIRKGTWNMAKGPAMTREEAITGIMTGIEIVKNLKADGINLLGTGEMGIGNTSTSSAVTAVFTGTQIDKLVGIGSGLSREAYINKTEVIQRAIDINQPDSSDPIDVLSKVGGFDIAGLTGCFLGAAIYKLPIVIDGFISATAALAAIRINPTARDYMFTSHGSAEPGADIVMKAIDMEPMMNLNMRVGEGTGAALGFQIIDAAIAAYTQMGTFDDAKIKQYVPQE